MLQNKAVLVINNRGFGLLTPSVIFCTLCTHISRCVVMSAFNGSLYLNMSSDDTSTVSNGTANRTKTRCSIERYLKVLAEILPKRESYVHLIITNCCMCRAVRFSLSSQF